MIRYLINSNLSIKQKLAVAFCFNLFLFTAFLLFFNIRYEESDDVGMMLISAGILSGTPDEHLVFTNVLIGQILKILYSQTAGFNWYTAYILTVHFISMVCLCLAFLLKGEMWRNLFWFLIIFFLFEIQFLQYLQFTTTAIIAAASGLFLLISTAETFKSAVLFFVAGALIIVAGLIRNYALYLFIIISFPLCLYIFFYKKNKAAIWIFSMLIGIVLLMNLYDSLYYSKDKEWKNYKQYNLVRGFLHENSNFKYTDKTKKVFDQVNWSKNDYVMFRHWMFEDDKTFSLESLNFLLKNMPLKKADFSLWGTLKGMAGFNFLFTAFVLAMLIFVILCVPLHERVMCILSFLLAFMLLIVIAYFAVLKPRLFMPVFMFLFILFSYYIKQTSTPKIIFVIFIIFSGLSGIKAIKKSNIIRAQIKLFDQKIEYFTDNPQNFYVNVGASLPFNFMSPFFNLEKLKRMNMYRLGWNSFSPINKKKLELNSAEANIFKALITEENAFMVIRKDYAHLTENIKTYYKEKYNTDIHLKPVEDKTSFLVLKLIRIEHLSE